MDSLIDFLLAIIVVCGVLYLAGWIFMVWVLWREDISTHAAEQQPKSVQTTGGVPKRETMFDAQMREYQEEDKRRRRERQMQAQWALQEQMRIAREAHDTAVQMHQQAHDDAVRMQQDSFSMHNSGGFGF